MALRLLFAGGGTGGHLIPALVVAGAVCRACPGAEIRFAATNRPLETRLLSGSPFPFQTVPVLSLRRELHLDLVRFPFVNGAGFLRSMALVARFRPHLFFTTGGYLAGPVGAAARALGVPVVLMEPNVFPGLTVRILSRAAAQVHLNDPIAARRVGGRQKPCSGVPFRTPDSDSDENSQAQARNRLELRQDRPLLLVTGGSQGARGINNAVLEALPILAAADFQILWQAGRLGIDAAATAAELWPGHVRAVEFIDDMPTAYRAADLTVSRAGAGTLAEQSYYGVPAILVPLPTAAENHQEYNARSAERRGAARVILQEDLTGRRLAETVIDLVKDSSRLKHMKGRSLEAARPNAAERIVETMRSAGLLRGDRR